LRIATLLALSALLPAYAAAALEGGDDLKPVPAVTSQPPKETPAPLPAQPKPVDPAPPVSDNPNLKNVSADELEREDPARNFVVTVKPDGSYFVLERAATLEAVDAALKTRVSVDKQVRLRVCFDPASPADLKPLMELAHKYKLGEVGLVMRAAAKPEPAPVQVAQPVMNPADPAVVAPKPDPAAVDPKTQPAEIQTRATGLHTAEEEGANGEIVQHPVQGTVNTQVPHPVQELAKITPLLQEAINQDQKATQEGRPLKASDRVALFKKVVGSEPENAEAYYRLALALSRAGDNQGSVSMLQRAVVLAPQNARILTDLSGALINIGEAVKAIDIGQQATKFGPTYTRAWYVMGNALMAAAKPQVALSAYEEAIRQDPDNARYLHAFGRAMLATGNADRAIEIFNEALKKNAKLAAAYNDRAAAQLRKKNVKKALEDYMAAIGNDPENPLYHYNIALLYADEANQEIPSRFDALDHAQKAVTLTGGKNATYLMGLAEALRSNHMEEDAVKAAKQAVSIDPSQENVEQLRKFEQIATRGFSGKVTNMPDDK